MRARELAAALEDFALRHGDAEVVVDTALPDYWDRGWAPLDAEEPVKAGSVGGEPRIILDLA